MEAFLRHCVCSTSTPLHSQVMTYPCAYIHVQQHTGYIYMQRQDLLNQLQLIPVVEVQMYSLKYIHIM